MNSLWLSYNYSLLNLAGRNSNYDSTIKWNAIVALVKSNVNRSLTKHPTNTYTTVFYFSLAGPDTVKTQTRVYIRIYVCAEIYCCS